MNNLLSEIPSDRKEIISHVLKDLEILKNNPSFQNTYAIQENIAFFEAIKSLSGYVFWLIKRAPKLERLRLLELTDFPFPRWDRGRAAGYQKITREELSLSSYSNWSGQIPGYS